MSELQPLPAELPEIENGRILVRERNDRKIASDFIETITNIDVFTPSHCSVVEVVGAGHGTGFARGDLVVVAAGDLSAFLLLDGQQFITLPARDVQARYNPEGTLLPAGRRIITQLDPEIQRLKAMPAGSRLVMPGGIERKGLSASGDPNPNRSGRKEDVQTVLYSPVVAVGPLAKNISIGDIVIFSPTVDVAELLLKGKTYHCVDSRDVEGRWPVK